MKIVNSAQMRHFDRIAIEQYGIPGVILMENAGISVAHEAIKMLDPFEKKEVVVLCGRGNNGGDGFVVARHLFNMRIPTKVVLIGDPSVIGGDARINYNIIKRLNLSITIIQENHELSILKVLLHNCELIVDAIFGIGLEREVDGIYKEVIELVNNSQKKTLSIDIPSGICADNGAVKSVAVKADRTLVFQLPKVGNINYPGAEYCGEVLIKDIGIPNPVIDDTDINLHLITREYIQGILPKRKKDTHKGRYGKVYMVAGSTGMTGAAMLASEAVLRSGAGLLKVAIPQSLNTIMEVRLTEAITVPLPELKKGAVGISDIEKIIKTMEQMDVIAIGPGSGQSREFEEVLRNVFERTTTPLVLDADALNALANRQELLKQFKSAVVLTPHVVEMSRLTNLDRAYIEENRIEVAQNYSKVWNAIVVLKGARTVVAGPGGETYINTTGNPGMATAGSGDVLTGIITGLIAQGILPFEAACAAVYIHGEAGDRAAARVGQYGMIAGDIVQELPMAIKDLVGI